MNKFNKIRSKTKLNETINIRLPIIIQINNNIIKLYQNENLSN